MIGRKQQKQVRKNWCPHTKNKKKHKNNKKRGQERFSYDQEAS